MKLAILISFLAVLGPMVQATNHMRRYAEEENRDDDTERMLSNVDNAAGTKVATLFLTDQQLADLLYLSEEEKMARDICAVFWEKHDIVLFETVMNTEQRHMDMIRNAKARHGIKKVADRSKAGVYTNQKLQDIYTEMTDKHDTTFHKALLNSALITETAILGLRDAISELNGNQPKLAKVYDTLLDDSENHLRIFAGVLATLDDADYEAQHEDMDQGDVDDILDHGWHCGD
jgi:hypothetical protein